MLRRLILLLAVASLAVACGRGSSSVDPGPGQPEETTSTSTTDAPEDEDDDAGDDNEGGDTDQVETVDDAPATTVVAAGDEDAETTATTIVVDPNSENADAYLELGASGLVLSLDEQACADDAVTANVQDGAERLNALVDGVKECASPVAVDTFASGLLSAGGTDLPANEAACVAATLRSDDGYLPFWAALFDEEPFDFLAAETGVQNLYLDLFSDCVSVGRALSNQVGGELSVPSIDCIDSLYADREFVRVTIEADLSGDADETDRVNQQVRTCLSSDERDRLGVG